MKNQIDLKKELLSWFFIIVFSISVSFICKQYLFSPVVVEGASMEPTYEDQDVIIISKISDIKRFDQIVFQSPIEDELYIKRVIGLPGDTIEMKDDVLYINGEKYEEPYVNRKENRKKYTEDFTLEELIGEKTVPDGHVFVLGDNRLRSSDSRHYGIISMDEIVGVSKVRILPIKQFEIF